MSTAVTRLSTIEDVYSVMGNKTYKYNVEEVKEVKVGVEQEKEGQITLKLDLYNPRFPETEKTSCCFFTCLSNCWNCDCDPAEGDPAEGDPAEEAAPAQNLIFRVTPYVDFNKLQQGYRNWERGCVIMTEASPLRIN